MFVERYMAQSKIVELCDVLVRTRHNTSTSDVEGLTTQLDKLRKRLVEPGAKSDKRLYKSLTVALTLYTCTVETAFLLKQIRKMLKDKGLWKTRVNSNPCLPYVKICIPDKHSRDYGKYAYAVKAAANKKMKPSEFYKALKRAGGMSGFIQKHKNKERDLIDPQLLTL